MTKLQKEEVLYMGFDKIVLARGITTTSDSGTTGRNNNQAIVGGSGSGKTMSITEPLLLNTTERNLIVTVTKPRIIRMYAPLLRERGYRVDVVDFTNPDNSTLAYDPLHYVRTFDDISFMARTIVMANPEKKGSKADPYWDEAAISLLSALMAYVMMMNPEPSLADVVELYRNMNINYNSNNITTSLDTRFLRLNSQAPGNFAWMNWQTFKNLPGRTAACVISALNVTLGSLFDPNLLGMMKLPTKLDFVRQAQEKTVLFLVTSPVNPSLNFFISQFYATALKELFDHAQSCPYGRLPIPMHIACDDFATGAPIPDFPQYISIIREADLSVSILCQSESQLESLYGCAGATTILNNCDTYIFTGSMDLATARSVSQRLNRPLEDCLNLPIGKFAIFRRGMAPVLAERYNILQDPLYVQVSQRYHQVAQDEVPNPRPRGERTIPRLYNPRPKPTTPSGELDELVGIILGDTAD